MFKISSVICKCQWKLKTVQATWDISGMTGMVYSRGHWMWVDKRLSMHGSVVVNKSYGNKMLLLLLLSLHTSFKEGNKG